MRSGWAVAWVDSTGIPSLNSRDAETGGAASESGCSISTLLLYQGESQNLVHTQMWCSTPYRWDPLAIWVMAIPCTAVTIYSTVNIPNFIRPYWTGVNSQTVVWYNKSYYDVIQLSVGVLDSDRTAIHCTVQMASRMLSASVCLLYNGYRKPYNMAMVCSSQAMELNDDLPFQK